jgi:hypothetical protein
VSINIITLTNRNEPFDINHINVKEEVKFYYTSDLALVGNETWEWVFGDGLPQRFTQNPDPIAVIFKTTGVKAVTLRIYSEAGDLLASVSEDIFVFDFPSGIEGADHVTYNTTSTFTIPYLQNTLDTNTKPTFKWFVNGKQMVATSNEISLSAITSKTLIECYITNGLKTVKYKKIVVVSVPNTVYGKKYESDVTSKLLFFNKEGDNLNFELIESEQEKRWEGEMIAHPNSSDTFKTVGLYVLEQVEPLQFAAPKSDILLEKFQLFTEYGVDFEPKWTEDIAIDNIVSVNNDPNFYTKWIIGNEIQNKIPIGAEIYLTDVFTATFDANGLLDSYAQITEFKSESDAGFATFTVVGNKRDAIMVITKTNNSIYNTPYIHGEFRRSNNAIQVVPQGKVKTFNLIKLYDTANYNSDWNESSYSNLLYDKKKISVVNTKQNDGIYTFNYINDDAKNELVSKYIKMNTVSLSDFIEPKNGFKIDIGFKTNKLLLSSGVPVDFLPRSKDAFLNDRDILVWEKLSNKDLTPQLLKAGLTFTFEQTNPTHPNLEMIYDCIRIDAADKLLTPQTDDTQGYRLILRDHALLKGITFSFVVNGIVTYTFTEGKEWLRGANLSQAINNLYTKMLDITGLSLLVENGEIWIWEKWNYKLENKSVVNNDAFHYQAGILTENNPKFGVIGDEWVDFTGEPMDYTIFNGYIHHRKEQGNFHILYFNKVDASTYVPNWYVLAVDKKVVWVEPTSELVFKQNTITECYLDNNTLSFEQAGDESVSVETLVQRFIMAYQKPLQTYGIDMYATLDDLCLTRTYPVNGLDTASDYLDVAVYSNGVKITDTVVSKKVDMLNVLETLSQEQYRDYGMKHAPKALSENWSRRIIVKDIDQKFGFVMNINGIDYPVTFDNIATSLSATEDNIVDIEETLMDWGNQPFKLSQDKTPVDTYEVGRKYHEVLESLGVLVWLEKSVESYADNTQRYDTLVIESKYPNVPITYTINGTLDAHKIQHSDIQFMEIGATLNITINRVAYSVPNQGSVDATLALWHEEFAAILLEQEIVVDLGTGVDTNVLRIATLREKTNFNYQVFVGRSANPERDMFYITNWRKGNEGIILSSNEINVVNGADFQESGFATGMVMSINGSKYPLNNQEYNLIFVDPVSLVLSYQGAFWSENDLPSYIPVRSGFDWTAYDEFDYDSLGRNLIANGSFLTQSWWKFNEEYNLDAGKAEVGANVGFQTPLLQIPTAEYKLSFTSSAGTDTEREYVPVTVSVFSVEGNTHKLLFQHIQQEFGAFEETIKLNAQNVYILFANGQPEKYLCVDNVSFVQIEQVHGTDTLTLSTREFMRFPRERFDAEAPVQFKFSWLEQDDNSLFLYDFSGEQLVRDNSIYRYTGTFPLLDVESNGYLNEHPNKDLTKVSDPKFQRTVWDELYFNLKKVDSETDLNPLPTPIQVFVGYKSLDEGVNRRTLLIHRMENVAVDINTRSVKVNGVDEWVDIINFNADKGELSLENSNINLIQLGFKKGQKILVTGNDLNKTNQAVFKNAGFEGFVEAVYINKLVVKSLNKTLKTESSKTVSRSMIPPFKEKVASISVRIEVIPEEIGRIQIKGQTEIEDERFKVQLNNFGFNVNHRDTFIFKEYDIKENGVDWGFLNTKRKEMLLMYPQIYNYLGSYKSLVNAINYFGYNDLELYEYYKNVDPASKHHNKLHKIEIPDIFDSKVAGYTPNDYIIKSLPDTRYEKTRLFNLTYRITDTDGNNVMAYSLDEVITKLLGLKRWLRDEIMPIGTRIMDITGRGSSSQELSIWQDVKRSTKLKMSEYLTPVDFKVEAYLQPVENGSRTYNVNLNFFTNDTEDLPDYYHVRITTFAAKPNIEDPNFRLKSVQLINEFKTDYKPYNFAADKTVDPFILVEVSCDNGYGANYTVKQTYSLEAMALI